MTDDRTTYDLLAEDYMGGIVPLGTVELPRLRHKLEHVVPPAVKSALAEHMELIRTLTPGDFVSWCLRETGSEDGLAHLTGIVSTDAKREPTFAITASLMLNGRPIRHKLGLYGFEGDSGIVFSVEKNSALIKFPYNSRVAGMLSTLGYMVEKDRDQSYIEVFGGDPLKVAVNRACNYIKTAMLAGAKVIRLIPLDDGIRLEDLDRGTRIRLDVNLLRNFEDPATRIERALGGSRATLLARPGCLEQITERLAPMATVEEINH